MSKSSEGPAVGMCQQCGQTYDIRDMVGCTATKSQRYYGIMMCKNCMWEEVLDWAGANGYRPGVSLEDTDIRRANEEEDETESEEVSEEESEDSAAEE